MTFRTAGTVHYKGTSYSGWQRQLNAPSIQESLEDALSIFYQEEVSIFGCGRTDAGVHAKNYIFHFISRHHPKEKDIMRINAILPQDIALVGFTEVGDDFHARHSAISRHYRYYIHQGKDPFLPNMSWSFVQWHKMDFDLLHECAELFKRFEDFFPFCKANSGVDHYKCKLYDCHWIVTPQRAEFYVKANRFLRGMIRLMVGAQINVALGKLSIDDLQLALENQVRLARDLSAPADGLFLERVDYPLNFGIK